MDSKKKIYVLEVWNYATDKIEVFYTLSYKKADASFKSLIMKIWAVFLWKNTIFFDYYGIRRTNLDHQSIWPRHRIGVLGLFTW
jgi:hypothetical protein